MDWIRAKIFLDCHSEHADEYKKWNNRMTKPGGRIKVKQSNSLIFLVNLSLFWKTSRGHIFMHVSQFKILRNKPLVDAIRSSYYIFCLYIQFRKLKLYFSIVYFVVSEANFDFKFIVTILVLFKSDLGSRQLKPWLSNWVILRIPNDLRVFDLT